MNALEWIFWLSAAAVVYTFAGYPLLLRGLAKVFGRPVQKAPLEPSLSILIAVHNGEQFIARKLETLLSIDWPKEKLEVIVISDGSTDSTNAILKEYSARDARVRSIEIPHSGKASALNAGVAQAKSEVLVLTDVRQVLEPRALHNMTANYADPRVGGVSGTLMIGSMDASASGESLKWGIENSIREREGAIASVVGALGAFYSIRRELFTPIPAGLLLDDMWVPLHVVKQGRRIVFERHARAWDDVEPTKPQEFRRKVRTLTGNYQLLKHAPWLVGPANPILFQYVSHKLMRLLAPFALSVLLLSSIFLAGPIYLLAFVVQALFYLLAALALLPWKAGVVRRVAEIAHTFVMLNVAAFMGLVNFLRRREDVWVQR